MINKGRLNATAAQDAQPKLSLFTLLTLSVFLSIPAHAERRSAVVLETSSSGKLVRMSIGASSGLAPNGPVLFSSGDKKVAAGRVVRLSESTAVVAVLEKYTGETPSVENDYELLYGEPFPEAANLPDYVVDRETETANPANETFFTKNAEEMSPELDDDTYTPEITLRPKMPEPRSYNAHGMTFGVALFRNALLPTPDQPDTNQPGQGANTTYQGYAIRYSYTFRTNYWLKSRMPALLSVEAMLGIYNFEHTFPATEEAPEDRTAQVRVFTPGMNVRYMVEVSPLFRVYPYVGYLVNIAGATAGNLSELKRIAGGRIIGGAGAQLIVSDAIDARVEGGSDGVMGGLVVKF
ncbi:MAG: hypothetical protein EOP11_05500 [Proteobacteria bacterium]|nr:MAG: hypothetical protein EOP11_05500 [Pseudomonadota bacterium]